MTIDMTAQIDNATPTLESTTAALQAGLRSLTRAITRIQASGLNQANQRAVICTLKHAVSAAMESGSNFDEASRAYRAANNKLDRLIESADSDVNFAKAGIDTLVNELLNLSSLLTTEHKDA